MPKKNAKKLAHKTKPSVAVVMGSQSDWVTMEHGVALLEKFEVAYHAQIVSAHRTPHRLYAFSQQAQEAGYKVIIAAAGGAAHLPGMVAALTTVPVLGVPIPVAHLQGLDSLLSIVQMPQGIPVGTLAIGKAGAINAAWLAMQILATDNNKLRQRIIESRQEMVDKVEQQTLPAPTIG